MKKKILKTSKTDRTVVEYWGPRATSDIRPVGDILAEIRDKLKNDK